MNSSAHNQAQGSGLRAQGSGLRAQGSGLRAQHSSRFFLLIAIALFGFGCAPSGGSFADIVDRHFEVVTEDSAGHPKLVAKTTLRNLRADFTQAARNLHQDCAKAAIATGCARINGVDVYWAVGSATIHAENAILLVTADDGSPPGNASATATGDNTVAYAIPGARLEISTK